MPRTEDLLPEFSKERAATGGAYLSAPSQRYPLGIVLNLPLKDRLQAVRWACGSVFVVAVWAFLTFLVVLYRSGGALFPMIWAVIASFVSLHVTFWVSLRLLLRWRDPTPEDRKRIRSRTFWGGAWGWIFVIWTLSDEEATSPFFKDWNR